MQEQILEDNNCTRQATNIKTIYTDSNAENDSQVKPKKRSKKKKSSKKEDAPDAELKEKKSLE